MHYITIYQRLWRPSSPSADIQRAPASPSNDFLLHAHSSFADFLPRESCRKTRPFTASERAFLTWRSRILVRNFSVERSRVAYILHLPRFRRKSRSALTAAGRIALRTRWNFGFQYRDYRGILSSEVSPVKPLSRFVFFFYRMNYVSICYLYNIILSSISFAVLWQLFSKIRNFLLLYCQLAFVLSQTWKNFYIISRIIYVKKFYS